MANEDLHPILNKIHETIGTVAQKIDTLTGEVKKIRKAVTRQTETLVDAINDNAQAQMEMKMMEHVVDVKSIAPQIDAEQEQMEMEQEELDRRLERIAERYEEKHEELDDKAAKRVRDVGAHIFEIDEQEFEQGIEDPFVEYVTPAWQSLQIQNDKSKNRRRDRVESKAGEVVSEIHNFVDQQEQLVNRIRKTRTDAMESVAEPTSMQVPYYVVTTETNGQTEQHLVVPSQVTSTDGPCTATLEPLPGMDQLISSTELNSAQTDRIQNETLIQALDPYIKANSLPMISYRGAVESAIPDQVNVATEANPKNGVN